MKITHGGIDSDIGETGGTEEEDGGDGKSSGGHSGGDLVEGEA